METLKSASNDAFKMAHIDSYKVTHDKAYDIEWVGKRVVKISGKPFKSGAKIGTVAGLAVHPKTQRLCFTFR